MHESYGRDSERMRASRGTATFFSLAALYRFCGEPGGSREQVELGSSLKHERRVQEGREPRENKRKGESCWKSGGGRVCLYTWRRAELADEVGSMPDAAGGHGAVRTFLRLLSPSVPRVRAFHSRLARVFDIFSYYLSPLPHFSRGAYFGSSSSLPKIDFSPIYLLVLARSIYGTVFPTGLRPCLPRRPPSLKLSFKS